MTVTNGRTGPAPDADEEEVDLAAPETRAAGRWNSAGVPTERSKDFGHALRRLAGSHAPGVAQAHRRRRRRRSRA